jgi:hypothetical protein
VGTGKWAIHVFDNAYKAGRRSVGGGIVRRPSTAAGAFSFDGASLAQDDVLPATAAPLGMAQDDGD